MIGTCYCRLIAFPNLCRLDGPSLGRNSTSHQLSTTKGDSPPEIFAVVLASTVEHNGPRRHVDAHCESFCSEQDLHQPSAEANLNDFLFATPS